MARISPKVALGALALAGALAIVSLLLMWNRKPTEFSYSYKALPQSTAVIEVEFTSVTSNRALTVEVFPNGAAKTSERERNGGRQLLSERHAQMTPEELESIVRDAARCGLHTFDASRVVAELERAGRRAPRVFDGGAAGVMIRFDSISGLDEYDEPGPYTHRFSIRNHKEAARAWPDVVQFRCASDLIQRICDLELSTRRSESKSNG